MSMTGAAVGPRCRVCLGRLIARGLKSSEELIMASASFVASVGRSDGRPAGGRERSRFGLAEMAYYHSAQGG